MKKSKLFRAVCVALCAVCVLLLATACSGGSGSNSTTAGGGTALATTMPAPSTTAMPTTTAVPTTPRPTQAIDPSLPYFDQEVIEFQNFGFTNGDLILGTDEASVLGKFSAPTGAKKTDVDLTGQDVPFTVAKQIDVAAASTNFWDIGINKPFVGDYSFTSGDIVAGCLWIKDNGGQNPGKAYIAVKTPTDNWASESIDTTCNPILATTDGQWKKVYFYGEIVNDEAKASTAALNLYFGYGPQSVQIGGLFIERFPATDDNTMAELNIPFNF